MIRIFSRLRLLGWCVFFLTVGSLQNGIARSRLVSGTPVFVMGEGGYHSFRIPAVILGSDGRTLLAFAEGRKHSRSDTGDIDLLLKRSTDGGKSWGEITVVWDDAEHVCGNPAPVVDAASGRIVLLATWNLGSDHEKDILYKRAQDTRRVFVLTSADNGLNWSAPKEITGMTKKADWTWYATGPCHAIQLENRRFKGRIVVPCDHAYLKDSTSVYRSHLIYSDDGGEQWHIGGISGDDGNESTVAELSTGVLLLNMRSSGTSRTLEKCRLAAYSKDGGECLSPNVFAHALTEPVCQGSILNFKKQGKLSTSLLFSNPKNPDKRRDLTVQISEDDGETWEILYAFGDSPAAYSDLVQLDKDRVGILYEHGEKKPYDQISFSVIAMD